MVEIWGKAFSRGTGTQMLGWLEGVRQMRVAVNVLDAMRCGELDDTPSGR